MILFIVGNLPIASILGRNILVTQYPKSNIDVCASSDVSSTQGAISNISYQPIASLLAENILNVH